MARGNDYWFFVSTGTSPYMDFILLSVCEVGVDSMDVRLLAQSVPIYLWIILFFMLY